MNNWNDNKQKVSSADQECVVNDVFIVNVLLGWQNTPIINLCLGSLKLVHWSFSNLIQNPGFDLDLTVMFQRLAKNELMTDLLVEG